MSLTRDQTSGAAGPDRAPDVGLTSRIQVRPDGTVRIDAPGTAAAVPWMALTTDCPVLCATGEVAAGLLQPGDLLLARGGRPVPLAGIVRTVLDWRMLGLDPRLRPVRVAAGSLGPGLPARDLLLSPDLRIQTSPTGGRFRPARDLPGAERADATHVCYLRLQTRRPARVQVAGVWCATAVAGQ